MIDVKDYKDLNNDEKFKFLKTFEESIVINMKAENIKYDMEVVEVITLNDVVIRWIYKGNNREKMLEFITGEDLIYYINKLTVGEESSYV